MEISLEQRINEDIKKAMLEKQAQRLAALRAVKAAILLEKTSGADHTITDAEVKKIMVKLVKQRKESAQLYEGAGRSELAQNELAEAAYIEEYLPRPLSDEELQDAVCHIISQTDAHSIADMGRVMGAATKQLAEVADGKAISALVRKLLSGGDVK